MICVGRCIGRGPSSTEIRSARGSFVRVVRVGLCVDFLLVGGSKLNFAAAADMFDVKLDVIIR